MTTVKQAFGKLVMSLPIEAVRPQREVSTQCRALPTYKRIASSIGQIGLVEPIAVYAQGPNDYLLLDGHIRLDVLKQHGAKEIPAFLATDDEAYTYNKRVNCVPPITEHYMILKALANGVDEQKLATALNVDISKLQTKQRMLDGICPEAVEVLRDTDTTSTAFAVLKKMKPVRQVAAAEHMRASGIYSARFATALLEVTRPELRLDLPRYRKTKAASAEAQAVLEEESDLLVRDLKAMEESYGIDVLTLSVSSGYIRRLLSNAAVQQFLEKHHPDILGELRTFMPDAKPARSAALAS
jgi:hypothetical protein